MPGFVTTSSSGESPMTVANPVVAFVPADDELTVSTVPSVHGEYRFPSAAQEGYQVSACVYSAWRPVNARPFRSSDCFTGQPSGGGVPHRREFAPRASNAPQLPRNKRLVMKSP